MGKHPIGPVLPHVKVSGGGEAHVMKFYATQNETTYGSHWQDFEPRGGRHSGAGYKPNIRPQIYYTEHLDTIDNQPMGRIVAGNYLSQTGKDYVGYGRPYGKEQLPYSAHYAPTGFVREQACHIPSSTQMRNQYIDTRLRTAPCSVPGKHKPLLHKKHPKDPVTDENAGHGPGYMSTEYDTRYRGRPWESVDLTMSVGPKELTGFTENRKQIEPVTYNPEHPHRNDRPGWMTHRPIGTSMYTTSHRPIAYLHGTEPLKGITPYSDRMSGYVKGNQAVPDYVQRNPTRVYDKASDMITPRLDKLKKADPAEYLNATHPNPHSSIYTDTYKGLRVDPPSEAAKLGRADVGSFEDTGHTSNNINYTQTRDNPARFITHHMTKFHDTSCTGQDSTGHLCWHVDPICPDGYTKSTQVHQLEPQRDSFKMLRRLDPYHARSVVQQTSISMAPTKMLA